MLWLLEKVVMQPIKLTLPIPVSVNALYANSKHSRIKTRRAKEWELNAAVVLSPELFKHRALRDANLIERQKFTISQLCKAHESLSYSVKYSFAFSQARSVKPRDIFNFEKQLTDFLVDFGFMLDDVFIDDGRVIRLEPDAKNPHVDIEISTFNKGILHDVLDVF